MAMKKRNSTELQKVSHWNYLVTYESVIGNHTFYAGSLGEKKSICGKNVARFQESYLSPYSQKSFKLGSVGRNTRIKFSHIKGIQRAAKFTHNAYIDSYLSNTFAKNEELREEVEEENEEHQFIYIIPDGVDLIRDKYSIYKQDIKPFVDSMLPDKEEIERKFPYLSKKEKINMLLPSEQIREQVFRQFLAEISENMKTKKEYNSLFTIKKKKINDLMDINEDMKVFIISTDDMWIGVTGLDTIKTENYRVDENRKKAKEAFLEAWEKWIDNHKVDLSMSNANDPINKHPALLYKQKYM